MLYQTQAHIWQVKIQHCVYLSAEQASSVFHLRMRQLQVIRDKQAISAADLTWEQYIFCDPSPGMFLLILCLFLMTSDRIQRFFAHCEIPNSHNCIWTICHKDHLGCYNMNQTKEPTCIFCCSLSISATLTSLFCPISMMDVWCSFR